MHRLRRDDMIECRQCCSIKQELTRDLGDAICGQLRGQICQIIRVQMRITAPHYDQIPFQNTVLYGTRGPQCCFKPKIKAQGIQCIKRGNRLGHAGGCEPLVAVVLFQHLTRFDVDGRKSGFTRQVEVFDQLFVSRRGHGPRAQNRARGRIGRLQRTAQDQENPNCPRNEPHQRNPPKKFMQSLRKRG